MRTSPLLLGALMMLAPAALAAAPLDTAPPGLALDAICAGSGYNPVVCALTTALCLAQPSGLVCLALA